MQGSTIYINTHIVLTKQTTEHRNHLLYQCLPLFPVTKIVIYAWTIHNNTFSAPFEKGGIIL